MPPRAASPGRPARFCSSACRSAAHRKRTRELRSSTPAAAPTQPERYDAPLRNLANELVEQANRLYRLTERATASDPDLAPLAVLRQLASVREDLDDLTVVAVQQARSKHTVHWGIIAKTLDVSTATASRTWSTERAVRRLAQRQRRLVSRRSSTPLFEQRTRPTDDPAHEAPPAHPRPVPRPTT
ncbi:hypothetical protein GXW82_44045 [Streptacidiphilus sp. 4-A2]|nr:hypothetical protein [Streptacidiphilus sp. 4-A2]